MKNRALILITSLFFLTGIGCSGGGGGGSNTTNNNAPSSTITAPANGHSVAKNTNINFTGTGDDNEDGALTGASLVWTSDLDGALGTGADINVASLSVGDHVITLTAIDSDGATGTQSIDVTVTNTAPTAAISAPTDGDSYVEGTTITFSGSGIDPEDGALGGTALAWTSDVDGAMGTGTSVNTSTLSIGPHVVTLTATDPEGLTDTAVINVTINPNTAPSATITAPTTGASFSVGSSVNFTGTGTDNEDGSLTGASLTWTSDVNGAIGTGVSTSSSTLSIGAHVITLTATDSGGLTDTDTINITIFNTAPVATITAPTTGSVVTAGDTVNFSGTGSDVEDGTLTGGSLVWSSSVDGPIGTGTSVSTAALSVGAHLITLTATDTHSGVGTDSVNITVNAVPVASITSPSDGTSFNALDTIAFTGTGSDTEDGTLSGASLVWSSDVAGDIGTGDSFSIGTLASGAHVITLTATDGDGASGTDSVLITIVGNLPDTGQTGDYTATFGEDSDYVINPHQYTKLDASGNALDPSALVWATVRDDVTGLIWEVKTDDDGPQDTDNVYTFAEAQAFIAGLNAAELGGYDDWRLPTIKELSTLVDASIAGTAIATAYFPLTVRDNYWSTTVYELDSAKMWTVFFYHGFVMPTDSNATTYCRVRAVRDAQ